MADEVAFFRMSPQDHLLTHHDPFRVWCLAETGKQYLVFSCSGEPFWLHVTEGNYGDNVWVDAKTGEQRPFPILKATAKELSSEDPDERRIGTKAVKITPPDRETDWVLILRSGG